MEEGSAVFSNHTPVIINMKASKGKEEKARMCVRNWKN